MWLGPLIARKSWNGTSTLFWMFISYFLHSLFAFSQFISQKKKKNISLFSLSGMNSVIPLSITINEIIQCIIQEILAFISLFAFL